MHSKSKEHFLFALKFSESFYQHTGFNPSFNTFTAGFLSVLQVEEQMLHLGHFGGVDELAFLHHLPGQQGYVSGGVQTLQSNTAAEHLPSNTPLRLRSHYTLHRPNPIFSFMCDTEVSSLWRCEKQKNTESDISPSDF